MHFEPCAVNESDSSTLIRDCEWPAMRDDPLSKIMFPRLDAGDEEECIIWTIDGLSQTIEDEATSFVKVCETNGTPLGFAGWRIESAYQMPQRASKPPRSEDDKNLLLPKALDVSAWSEVSHLLREEKMKVLGGRRDIWRLFTLSVHPNYQRRGIGSSLLKWGCEFADRHGYISFVMASPVGLTLYQQFGFEIVGRVHTEHGDFTSMLRNPGIH